MRLPNGYGSVFKLNGNRRRPWTARITTGWDEDGKQLFKYLGYYESEPKAMRALANYNDQPIDLNKKDLTFAEIYERVIDEKWPNGPTERQQSNFNTYRAAFNWSNRLHDRPFSRIRLDDLYGVINRCTKGHQTKLNIRTLFNAMFKYAMARDIVHKNYVQFINLGTYVPDSKRKPFTSEEIQKLWKKLERYDFIKYILILIYTGLRPGELVEITTNNIYLDERYMIGGFKTKAGTDRIIPIHKKILPFVKEAIDNEQEFLVVRENGTSMTYSFFYERRFKPLMETLNIERYPHECRHTFATLMDNAGANKVSIQRILGHVSTGVTDEVYTHKDVEELRKAVDLLD